MQDLRRRHGRPLHCSLPLPLIWLLQASMLLQRVKPLPHHWGRCRIGGYTFPCWPLSHSSY